MLARLIADMLLLAHLGFIFVVVFGGLLLLRWPRIAWIQVPVAIWGIAISVGQWTCPLTPLENHFRRLGGQAGYDGSFIDHYLLPIVYPSGLDATAGLVLAALVAAVNAVCWTLAWRRSRGDAESGS